MVKPWRDIRRKRFEMDLPPIPLKRALIGAIRNRIEHFSVAGWLLSRGWTPANGSINIWENGEHRVPENTVYALKIESTRAAFEPLEKRGWRITQGNRNSHGAIYIQFVRIDGHHGKGPHYSLIGALKKERLI